MKNFLNKFVFVLGIAQLYVMEEPELTKKRNYTVDLQHLCPSVPSETAEKCTKSFNVTKYFKKLYTQDEAKRLDGNPDALPEKWIDLAECQLDNLDSPSISLEIHCYYEGVKEGIFEFFYEKSNKDHNVQEMFSRLDQKIATARNQYIKEMLEEVKVELEDALHTLDQQGLVVNAEAQPAGQ